MLRADVILKSTNIFTSEKNNSLVSGAVAVSGDKILAVITDESRLEDYIDDGTTVIDCKDNLIMPGFVDAHYHFDLSVLLSSPYAVVLYDARSEMECVDMLVEYRKKNPEVERIYGFGWLPDLWGEGGGPMPTRKTLDEAIPDIPVYLQSMDGHNWWLNTAALKETGVTKETKTYFGGYEKDDEGELTGIAYDTDAGTAIYLNALKLDKDKLKEITHGYMAELNRVGITALGDVAASTYPVGDYSYYEAYDELNSDLEDGVPVRMFLFPSLGRDGDFSIVKSLRDRYDSEKIRVSGLKQFIDGVTCTHTAFTLEPYSDAPDMNVEPLIAEELLAEVVSAANREGFSVRLHAISDGSARLGLDVFEKSQGQKGLKGIINTLEHLDNLDPQDIARFGELNVIPSMQPAHMTLTDSYFVKTLGEERAKLAYMHKELLEQGATLAFGTDCPCVDYNPFKTLYHALTRCSFEGEPITMNLEQAVSLEEALRAYTYGSACAVNAIDEIGTLTPGKFADIVVVDGPLFGEDPKTILDREAMITMNAGQIVYSKYETSKKKRTRSRYEEIR